MSSGKLVLDTAEVRTFGKGYELIAAQVLPEVPSRRLIDGVHEMTSQASWQKSRHSDMTGNKSRVPVLAGLVVRISRDEFSL
ncbi:hypothetical protein [Actinomadura chokoriensis]|uniref:Uncharacterized protein n=1 Tax=Actinomadura chokoriensis TaxID=454156 RepID=A0ABV4R7U2_9ACTN